MNFENFKIVSDDNLSKIELFLTNVEDIELCEEKLNIEFDNDYKDYVLTYGNGILGGTYIRIYLPERITEILTEWRSRIDEYWFWDEGKTVLTKEDALSSVIIGDTFDGDEIILYKNEYYILPRYSEMIYKLGQSLEEVVSWLCSAGILTEPFTEREFEPFDPKEWG